MDTLSKPVIRALVGLYMEPLGLVWWRYVSLEDAERYHAAVGAMVLIDPQDEEDLAAWERQQRSVTIARRGRT